MQPKTWVVCGALLAGLAVATGAFGAHALPNRLQDMGHTERQIERDMQNFETAARYQMYHSLALVAVGLAMTARRSNWLIVAGWFFLIGILLFSGCLYGLVVATGTRQLAAFVPVGGVAFMLGWFCLAMGAIGLPDSPPKTK